MKSFYLFLFLQFPNVQNEPEQAPKKTKQYQSITNLRAQKKACKNLSKQVIASLYNSRGEKIWTSDPLTPSQVR